jgi:hypothetical protein
MSWKEWLVKSNWRVRTEREISGLADPLFRFSINFIGAPALTAAEFANTGRI